MCPARKHTKVVSFRVLHACMDVEGCQAQKDTNAGVFSYLACISGCRKHAEHEKTPTWCLFMFGVCQRCGDVEERLAFRARGGGVGCCGTSVSKGNSPVRYNISINIHNKKKKHTILGNRHDGPSPPSQP